LDPEPIILLTETSNYQLLLSITILLFLLALSTLISGAEIAFFSLTKEELNKAQKAKSKKQKAIVLLLKNPQKLVATLLISTIFITILIVLIFVFIGNIIFAEILFTPLKILIEVVLIALLILFFGVVLPKVYATKNPLKFALLIAFPLKILNTLLSVISIPLMHLTAIIEKRLLKKQSNLFAEKLSKIANVTSKETTIKNEQKIVKEIASLRDTETSQIMTPRIDIFAISDTDLYENIISNIVKKGFSRNPVYTKNVDTIIGILYAKDLLSHLNKTDFEWQKLIREPYFVPENKKLDVLLKEFQEKKNHLAIVVDEYGGTSGIVTLEDIIEEIVGEINDEFDEDDTTYSKINATNYIFEGKTNLKDFYRILNIENSEIFDEKKGESDTIAGFIIEILGKFPNKNQMVKFNNYTFKIESMDKKRIKKIKVTINRGS